jgi:hypothetical protein
MLVVTPRQDIKRLEEYDARLAAVFTYIQEEVRQKTLGPGTSNYDLLTKLNLLPTLNKLTEDKPQLNEIAWRYGCEPPWDNVLTRFEHLSEYIRNDDPLESLQYSNKMRYLIGKAKLEEKKDWGVLWNPFKWPLAFLLFLITPFVKMGGPATQKLVNETYEQLNKLVAWIIALAVLIWIGHYFVHRDFVPMVVEAVKHKLGVK